MIEENSNGFPSDGLCDFFKNKKVLVTGHTGFKGSWLTKILLMFGTEVTGYSLEPSTAQNLFDMSGIKEDSNLTHVIGDIRDLEKLKAVFDECRPEIVFHLAAQPIVRESYKNPVNTYSTNVMGTVNVLECIRTTRDAAGNPVVRSFLNVTTDKVYQNREWCWGYRENESLDGYDPYSNSKSCSELATHAYRNSFFSVSKKEEKETGKPVVAISTARAGNVIGGGDFAIDRIIPDAVRAVKKAYEAGETEAQIFVRNPYSIRPYQHVLEPLVAYMIIAARQYENPSFAGYYNVGPDECDCVKTGKLVDLFCKNWNKGQNLGVHVTWERNCVEKQAPHEANLLKLDCSKIKAMFGWKPVWHIEDCIENTVRFVKVWMQNEDIAIEMERQIEQYLREAMRLKEDDLY